MAITSRIAPLPNAKGLGARLRGEGGTGVAPVRPAPLRPSRIALCVAIVVGVALAHVHVRLQVIEGGYALSRESRLKHDLEDANQKLRLELATRRDPALIERRARAELHMAPPDPGSIRTVRIAVAPVAGEAKAPAQAGGRP